MIKESTVYEETLTRQNAYNFLASLFLLEPKQETVLQAQQDLNHFLTEQDQLKVFVKTDNEVDRLLQEYYDLFFVPSSGVYVPPFESALKNYQPLKKKPYNRLFGKEAVHVQSCYEAVGFIPWDMKIFKPLKDVKFPDHIGFELAFMSVLCANELNSYEDEEKVYKWKLLQCQFLSEHLSKWVEHFSLAIKYNATEFYHKAGIAVRNWVLEDLEYLEEQVNHKKGGN